MTELLEISVQFPGNADQAAATEKALRDSVAKTFVDMGIEPDLVRRELGRVQIREESPLVFLDPGAAAVIVATIGVGVELIKIAVDLYKERNKQEAESRKHEQEMALRSEELELKKQQHALEVEKYKDEKSREGDQGRMVDEKDVRAFLDQVLIAGLAEQQNLGVSLRKSGWVKQR